MALETINPATGEKIKSFDEMTKQEVDEIIDHCHEEFLEWKNVPVKERSFMMKNASKLLKEKSEDYGKILTLEMGKPLKEAKSEVEKCAWVCEYYAENTEVILEKEMVKTDASESYVQFDPVGVVLAVMPWNFPFWQVFRFAAPALMAGNVGILKHASNVPMSALAIEQIFSHAGFPQNVFKTLLIGSSLVSDVIKNPKVKAATLTGSEHAGKKVAGECGKELKKSVMELGGSDPFIILKDADLDKAVDVAVKARLINNGESCIAAKRFIVVDDVYEEFENKFLEKMQNIKTGDPMVETTDIGPMAREDLMLDLHEQVKKSVDKGAKLLCGGEPIEGDGYFYPATVLTNVGPGMPAYEEELFGPVAAVIKAKDEDDAVRIANDSPYGLGAALWTSDTDKAKELAHKIESGSVFINGLVKSDPRLPFGGVKMSGYGRELSHYGIKEFLNIKTVWIA